MNKPTHTLSPNTGREIQINRVRFWNLLKRGFMYEKKLIDSMIHPCRWVLSSMFPSRECFLPAIAP